MKQLSIIVVLSIFFSCENKVTCPICEGVGSLFVYGEKQQCLTCNGSGKVTKAEYVATIEAIKKMDLTTPDGLVEEQYEDDMEDCPFCNGIGTNGSNTCGFCNGLGQVSSSAAAQGRHVIGGGSVEDFYPSTSSGSSNSSTPSRGCKSCNYTGDCQHCQGAGVVAYKGQYNTEDGYMKCPICKGNKRCNVCHGR